jgi:cytochrome b
VKVWDWPVRVFHWLAVACFAGAWLTAESERLHLVHITLGYTLGGLVAFRVLWGLLDTGPARFANFVRSPAAAWRYISSLLGDRPLHYTGHNPAGALAIVALLGLIGLTVGLGWATETERLPGWLDEGHELAANALMALVVVHLVGVAVGSLRHRENLPRAMLTGFKRGLPGEGIRRQHGWLGAGLDLRPGLLGLAVAKCAGVPWPGRRRSPWPRRSEPDRRGR